MMAPQQIFLRRRHRLTVAVVGAAVAASVFGSSFMAYGQDQSAATPTDAIVARKTMMDTLSDRMDRLEMLISSGQKIDLAAAHDDADIISVLLAAFPHLFPPSTNQWKPNVDRDPVTDTSAAPEVWTRYADFYKQAAAASKAAFNASRADQESDFKASIAQLRTACNTCHAAYMKMD
jgi:cytochrome c556